MAGIWGNVGDLRTKLIHLDRSGTNFINVATAVILSIMAGNPFQGQKDVDLGVAYIAVIILVFFVRLIDHLTLLIVLIAGK